ncbi:O-acetyl-ADP-ribose deacetylase macrod1 [Podila horticola]|nr:O-acetyl-ADP-ribose deacetylase macrod1 [Podila horticola]
MATTDIKSFIESAEFPPNETWNKKVSAWEGDMTKLKIDAIVDGAIHRAAGPGLLKECRALRGCDTGDAKMTGGYNLPAKHVIHTVGPQDKHPGTLKRCYLRTLDIVKENKLKSVAFCCISTGIYGFDNEKAAKVALKTVREWLDANEDFGEKMDRIIFCLFMPKDIEIYLRLLPVYFPPMQNEQAEEYDDTKGATSHSSMAVELGETISASTQSQKNEQGKTQVRELQAKDIGNALPLNDTPRGEAPAQVKSVEDSLLKDMKPEKKKNS